MIKTEQMYLSKTIIHRLDNQDYPTGKKLSDLELDLDDDLKKVITEHSKNGIDDKRRRYATFNEIETNIIRSLCYEIQNNPSTFVEKSKSIANNLYQHMGNKSISAADLVVTYFNDEDNYFVGILKLDFKNQYISEIEETRDGNRITIRKEDKGWPELGTRIQKAAFIKLDINLDEDTSTTEVDIDENAEVEVEPDLIILDRQKSASDEGDISHFFKDSFLYVDLISDERSNTKAFIKGLQDFMHNYESITYEKKRSIYDNGLDAIIRNDQVDIESFINQQFDTEESDEGQQNALALTSYFEKQGVTRGHFNVSEEISKKYQEKRQLVLSGVKLDIDLDVYNDSSKFDVDYYKNQHGDEFANIHINGLPVREKPKDD